MPEELSSPKRTKLNEGELSTNSEKTVMITTTRSHPANAILKKKANNQIQAICYFGLVKANQGDDIVQNA